jgi:hypothetical protein
MRPLLNSAIRHPAEWLWLVRLAFELARLTPTLHRRLAGRVAERRKYGLFASGAREEIYREVDGLN